MTTERDAYDAYRGHVETCGACSPSEGTLCPEGVRLHDAWKAAETRERLQTAGRRRR